MKELGLKSEKEYLNHAIEFLKWPCSDTIDGYVTEDGQVCRFNRTTGEYAKGVPGGKITTCFIARFNEKTGKANLEAANRYFDNCKNKEGVDEDVGESEKTAHKCPVCGKMEFPEIGSFDIYTECGWEDDLIQTDDPDEEAGANMMSLNKYKAAYESGWRPDWLADVKRKLKANADNSI